MRPTRRSVLKSGVAGFVAAGTSAAGFAQETSTRPKAVITSDGVLLIVGNNVAIQLNIVAESNGVLGQFGGYFYIFSPSTAENLARNAPLIVQSIVAQGGPTLLPQDLLFVGFDCLQG
jgi:hypothetical protein